MAKPNWLNVTPTEGSGNSTISNSASAHTGRVARTGTVTVTGSGVTTPATYKVTQNPKPSSQVSTTVRRWRHPRMAAS